MRGRPYRLKVHHLLEEYTFRPGGVEEGVAYEYDENGCQVKKTKGADITETIVDDMLQSIVINDASLDVEEYAYSYEQRLISYTDKTGKVTQYGFDDGQKRTYKKVGTADALIFCYDGEDTVYEAKENFASETVYVNGIGIDEKKVLVRDGAAYVYLSDGLGSTREITDTSGSVQSRYDYTAWGESTADVWNDTTLSESVSQDYQYTGRRKDRESKLYYYRARMYDPAIGRFISGDALLFDVMMGFVA